MVLEKGKINTTFFWFFGYYPLLFPHGDPFSKHLKSPMVALSKHHQTERRWIQHETDLNTSTVHIKWNRKSSSLSWISRISTAAALWNFQLKIPLWFKTEPKFSHPCPMCVVRQVLHFQPRSFWPFCPADFSRIFAGFLIHIADQREAEYFKAICILQDDKLFLLSNICIITTKIIFEMATRQYNF